MSWDFWVLPIGGAKGYSLVEMGVIDKWAPLWLRGKKFEAIRKVLVHPNELGIYDRTDPIVMGAMYNLYFTK